MDVKIEKRHIRHLMGTIENHNVWLNTENKRDVSRPLKQY